MVRPAYIDRNGTKKGAWSEEEDNKLKAYTQRHRHWNWRLLPKYAGLARCGKSCRLRWMNYLRPGLTRGKFTKEEGDLFIRLHAQFGNKWSAIAAKMPGRTDNDIKNYWHAYIKKRIQRSGRVTGLMKAQMPQEKQSSEIDYSTTDHQEEPAASMNVSLQGLSAGNPENIDVLNSITDSHSVAQVQVDPWSHLDDQTCFSHIDLPPFVEEEFHDFCLFQNDMSTFSDSSITSWNSSTAESQENVWSEPLEEDIVDVELW